MARRDGQDQELRHGEQMPGGRGPALALGGRLLTLGGFILAACAVPLWLLVILYGLIHGRIGDCWPYDQSSARWIPIVILGVLGLLCDLRVFGALIRKDHVLLRRAGLLSLLFLALLLILGPTALDLIGSRAPAVC